jgi:hypothetical protein
LENQDFEELNPVQQEEQLEDEEEPAEWNFNGETGGHFYSPGLQMETVNEEAEEESRGTL